MKQVLCFGGNGLLGRSIIARFTGHHVTSIDFAANPQAQDNIILEKGASSTNNQLVRSRVLPSKFHAILVAAGGWAGGSIKDSDYEAKLSLMLSMNLSPSLLAAHLATQCLHPDGLVVFTGSAAVFREPQPEMIAYALAKTTVHSLALNLAQQSVHFRGRVLTILPSVIDSEANRQAMPKADFSKWEKPDQIAELLKGWVDGLNVPENGAFVALETSKGCLSTRLI